MTNRHAIKTPIVGANAAASDATPNSARLT